MLILNLIINNNKSKKNIYLFIYLNKIIYYKIKKNLFLK